MATLSLEQLTKVFANGVEAVRQLDLFVDDGEFVVLVGPSGCGKTTALRMVAGLEDVTAGTIRLNGKVVNDLSAKERDVAMVFQNYALYPHMNVIENIAFSLRVRGVSKQERERKARETADDPRALGGGAPEARPALGRSAPARRHGAGAHPRAGRVPHGRAALEPRRQPARPDAQRGAAHPAAARRGDALRHPRPDRGDDDGRPGRGPPRRRAPAARRPAGPVRAAREPLRRLVHRLACDEPVRGDGLGARGSARPLARIAAARASRRPRAAPPGSRRRRNASSWSGSGPSI